MKDENCQHGHQSSKLRAALCAKDFGFGRWNHQEPLAAAEERDREGLYYSIYELQQPEPSEIFQWCTPFKIIFFPKPIGHLSKIGKRLCNPLGNQGTLRVKSQWISSRSNILLKWAKIRGTTETAGAATTYLMNPWNRSPHGSVLGTIRQEMRLR